MISKQIKDTTLTLDPLDHYKNDNACHEGCGILLEWLWEGAEFNEQAPSEVLEECYQYFQGWRDDASVQDERFCYPDDTPMAPLLRVVRGDEALFIYPHAIVAVVKDNKVKWTRMD